MSAWRPSCSTEMLHLRAKLNAHVRAFFAERDVLEVETPVFSAKPGCDPHLHPFTVKFDGPRSAGPESCFMRTSPEFAMKRMLAASVGDCYELGRVFRDGEAGRRHNPEFTLLEWYRLGFDDHQLMEEVASLLQSALSLVGRECTVRRVSYRQLFRETLGVDPFAAGDAELASPLAIFDIGGEGLDRDDWLDLLLTHLIEPALPDDQLLLLHDYPPSQAAMARLRDGDGGQVAARFEVFLGPLELANGYHELCDPVEQRQRLEQAQQRRLQRGEAAWPLDDRLLAALEQGMPECAGVALGMDRLLMAMTGSSHIGDVLAFGYDRA